MMVVERAKAIMEVKKGKSATLDGKKVVAFVGEVKQELKRIDWTDKEELKDYTKIVLISTFLFAMLIYFVDLAIQGILNVIQLFVRLIIG